MTDKRVTFASKIGIVAAAAGSAVGLGNIWRFPSQAADGGGAIFILVYVVCILFFGIPLMMSEFMVGRAARANTAGAFTKLAPGTPWKWVGRLGVLTGFMIIGFYMVVSGWTLDYFFQSISGSLSRAGDLSAHFGTIQANPWRQIAWMILFVVLTAFFITSGVKKGIERSAKIFMPLLFLLLIVLAIRSVTLEGATQGLNFLFRPDLGDVKPTVFLDAMGQAFFSLSIGMGCMITYGSYFNNNTDLAKTSIQVSTLDTLVAILAGVVIFPSAFALTTNPETIVDELVAGGPGLLFITLPELFNQMPLSMMWSTLFFCLLALAALTSTISLMEVVTVYLHEEYRLSRKKSTLMVALGVTLMGIVSSYSVSFFNVLDIASAKFMLPIGGFFICLFVGWKLKRNLVLLQLTNEGVFPARAKLLKPYLFLVRYVVPIMILGIFIYGLIG